MRWLWLKKQTPLGPGQIFLYRSLVKLELSFQRFSRLKLAMELIIYFGLKWINGGRITDIAPRLFSLIPKRITDKRTVQEALLNRRWVADIRGALTVSVLSDYLIL
jgi:hypothetical protein